MPDQTLPVQQPEPPQQPEIRPGITVDLDLGRLLQEAERPDLDGRMVGMASSMIVAAGFNLKTSELAIEFQNGRIYTYRGVPVDVWDGLVAASSKGKYLRANVIGVYPF